MASCAADFARELVLGALVLSVEESYLVYTFHETYI